MSKHHRHCDAAVAEAIIGTQLKQMAALNSIRKKYNEIAYIVRREAVLLPK